MPALATDGPLAQITAPRDGFKLRAGSSVSVRALVKAGVVPLRDWTLKLFDSDGSAAEIGRGVQAIDDEVVGEIDADSLVPGASYTLHLAVSDASGALATAQSAVRFSDPQYTLIPLQAWNLAAGGELSMALDASGMLSVIGGRIRYGGELIIRNSASGAVRRAYIDLSASVGLALSGNAQRLFYYGTFRNAGGTSDFGIGFLDLANDKATFIADNTSHLFTVDHTGTRLVFQAGRRLPGDDRTVRQLYLFDERSGTNRQLTDAADAIDFSSTGKCTERGATVPRLTEDGRTVILLTASALDVAPPPQDAGCRVFAYEVETGTLRHVVDIPASTSVLDTTLSGDGRWLSFASTRLVTPQTFRSSPVLIDLETATLTEPIGAISEYTSFDAVITGDGTQMLISTQADVDPRVGNADHTMDLFLYDRHTGQFTQVSDTSGGLGSRPGNCYSYAPRVSRDGSVVLFAFAQFSGDGCQLDGPQRNEIDGFVFRFVRAVRKRPGNRGPVFDAPSDSRVVAGDTLTRTFAASDPDGDPISFYIQIVDGTDVPPGSDIEDHHDGAATFTWPTTPENVGDYRLRVAAFDEGGGEVFHDFTITVAPEGRPADCAGDCNGDQRVTIEELVAGVNVALDRDATTSCRRLDTDQNARVTVDELVTATRRALDGCAGS